MKQGAVGCLVKLANTDDTETRLHCIGALCNLSASNAVRQQVLAVTVYL